MSEHSELKRCSDKDCDINKYFSVQIIRNDWRFKIIAAYCEICNRCVPFNAGHCFGNKEVNEAAIEVWNHDRLQDQNKRLVEIVEAVADGNFNQAELIKEARAILKEINDNH